MVGSSHISQPALMDSGASLNLLHPRLVEKHHIPLVALDQPVRLFLGDGKALDSRVTHQTMPLSMQIGAHYELIQFHVFACDPDVVLGMPWLAAHNPSVDWVTETVTFNSEQCLHDCVANPTSVLSLGTPNQKNPAPPALAFRHSWLSALYAGKSPDNPEARLATMSLLDPEDDDDDDDPVDETEFKAKVPEAYWILKDVFSKVKADILPEHRKYDCKIDLLPGTTPPWGRLFPLSEPETKILKEWLDDMLAKGFVRPSQSKCSVGCFFRPKKDGGLRLCMDYRGCHDLSSGFRLGDTRHSTPTPRVRSHCRLCLFSLPFYFFSFSALCL